MLAPQYLTQHPAGSHCPIHVQRCSAGTVSADGPRLSSVVPSNKTRGNGQKLMPSKLYLILRRNFFTVQWASTGTDCPERGCEVSLTGDSQE